MVKLDPRALRAAREQGAQRVIVFLCSSHECIRSLEGEGIHVERELPFMDACIARADSTQMERIAALKSVEYVSADVQTSAQMDIAKPLVRAGQWHTMGVTGRGVGVAVLDTGLYPHPDFIRPQSRIKAFVDFVNERDRPYDDNGHGTFVAGVVAGNGHSSQGKYAGIAPDAHLVGLKVMDDMGKGSTSSVLNAMQWVVDHGRQHNIRIISLSLGAPAAPLLEQDALARATQAMWDRGIVMICAAGNEGPGPGSVTSPGASLGAITVGAFDDKRTLDTSQHNIAQFSGRGPVWGGVKPDVVCPGVDVTGCGMPEQGELYVSMSGTSVAAPVMAGMAALLLQRQPDLTNVQIKQIVARAARRISGLPNAEGRGAARLELFDQHL